MKSAILSFVFTVICLCSSNAQIQKDTLTLSIGNGVSFEFAAPDSALVYASVDSIIESVIAHIDTLSVESPLIQENEKELFLYIKSLDKKEQKDFVRETLAAAITASFKSTNASLIPLMQSAIQNEGRDSVFNIDFAVKPGKPLEE